MTHLDPAYPNPERQALWVAACVLCHHLLVVHRETSLHCQHYTKPHWWSRRVQCPCDMTRSAP